jgi:hypothetical protein
MPFSLQERGLGDYFQANGQKRLADIALDEAHSTRCPSPVRYVLPLLLLIGACSPAEVNNERIAGQYIGEQVDERRELIIRPDGTFKYALNNRDGSRTSSGKWHLWTSGEGNRLVLTGLCWKHVERSDCGEVPAEVFAGSMSSVSRLRVYLDNDIYVTKVN